jgi:hypothetical protein
MLPRTQDCDSCRKSAVVLTCFVNGHKRFVAAPLAQDEDLEDQAGQSWLPDSLRAAREAWIARAASRRPI